MDGSIIPNIEVDNGWDSAHKAKEPACCYYGFEKESKDSNGKLYN